MGSTLLSAGWDRRCDPRCEYGAVPREIGDAWVHPLFRNIDGQAVAREAGLAAGFALGDHTQRACAALSAAGAHRWRRHWFRSVDALASSPPRADRTRHLHPAR